MARQTVGRTAFGTEICRLIMQYQPEGARLFDDPVVKEMVGGPIRLMMRFDGMRKLTIRQTDGIAPGIFGGQICRTRYIDDAVQATLSQGIDQLVILGAGFDTRPYRLPGMERVQVFESGAVNAFNRFPRLRESTLSNWTTTALEEACHDRV